MRAGNTPDRRCPRGSLLPAGKILHVLEEGELRGGERSWGCQPGTGRVPPSAALRPPSRRPGRCLPPLPWAHRPRLPQPLHSPRPASSQGGRERTSPSRPRCGAPGPAVVPRLRVRCGRAAAPRGWEAVPADVCSETVCALPKIRVNYY